MSHLRPHVLCLSLTACLLLTACGKTNQSTDEQKNQSVDQTQQETDRNTEKSTSGTNNKSTNTDTTENDAAPTSMVANFKLGGMVFRDGKV